MATTRLCVAAISANGELAAAVDAGGRLHVYDFASGDCSLALREAPPGGALCFAKYARDEVVYGVGNRARVVDARTRRVVTTLLGHQSPIHFATSAERWALTHSPDAVILWSVADWSRLRSLVEPSASVLAAELSPRGSSAALLYADSRIGIWSTDAGSPKAELRPPEHAGQAVVGLQRLAVGRDFVAAATAQEAAGSGACALAGSLLVLWPLAEAGKGIGAVAAGATVAPEGLCVQLHEQVSQLHARGELLYLAHGAGVRVMVAKTQRLVYALEAPCLLHCDVDRSGDWGVLVSAGGELERHSLSTARRAPPARGHRRGTPTGLRQPSQGRQRAGPRQPAAPAPDLPVTAPGSVSEAILARKKLSAFLRKHGAFPEATRPDLWRLLLQLPGNEQAYRQLSKEAPGAHAESLAARVEPPESRECQGFARTLAAVLEWAPLLADVPYLAKALVGFVRVFRDDELLAFEGCAAFLLAWVRHWLQAFPDPPLEDLHQAWLALRAADPDLADHLEACAGTGEGSRRPEEVVLWPMVQSALFDCLPQDVWLVLWDHLLVSWQDRSLLALAAVAVLRCLRGVLLALPPGQPQQLERLLRRSQSLPADRALQAFLELRRLVPKAAARPLGFIGEPATQRPLIPKGDAYPPLLSEPHFVLDYHVRDRARARQRAEEARRSVDEASGVHSGLEELAAGEAQQHLRQAKLLRQEEARRALAREDDERLAAEQQGHLFATAAARLERVDRVTKAADAWLEQQQGLHEAEAARLSDELLRQRGRLAREGEELQLETTLGDLELMASRRLADVRQRREVDAAARDLRQGVRTELLGREHRDDLAWRRQWAENERERLEVHEGTSQRLQDAQLGLLEAQRREVKEQLSASDRLREAQVTLIGRVRQAREAARHAQSEAGERARTCHDQVESDTQNFSHDVAEQLSHVRQQREQQAREHREALLREQEQWQLALDEQDRERYEASLAEERARFKERLGRLLLEDRAQSLQEQDDLRREISRLQKARAGAAEERANLERRRKRAERRENELGRSWLHGADEQLPREERRRLRKALEEHVPRPRAASVGASGSGPGGGRQRGADAGGASASSSEAPVARDGASTPPFSARSASEASAPAPDALPPPTRLARPRSAASSSRAPNAAPLVTAGTGASETEEDSAGGASSWLALGTAVWSSSSSAGNGRIRRSASTA